MLDKQEEKAGNANVASEGRGGGDMTRCLDVTGEKKKRCSHGLGGKKRRRGKVVIKRKREGLVHSRVKGEGFSLSPE